MQGWRAPTTGPRRAKGRMETLGNGRDGMVYPNGHRRNVRNVKSLTSLIRLRSLSRACNKSTHGNTAGRAAEGAPASGVTGTTQPAATRQTRRPPRRSPQRKDRPRAAISHDHTLAGTSLLTRGSVPPRATVQAVWPRSRHPRQLCWFFLR